MAKPDYDTTLARIAGNVAAGMMPDYLKSPLVDRAATRASIVATSVELARAIVAEVKRTEPKAEG